MRHPTRPLCVLGLLLISSGLDAQTSLPPTTLSEQSVASDALSREEISESVLDTNYLSESLSDEGVIAESLLTEEEPDFQLKLNRSTTTWIAGSKDDFDLFSFESTGPMTVGKFAGITLGYGFHLLEGPVVTDMPPRLFDFHMGYHLQDSFGPAFRYDMAVQVGAYSDFEGSARDGVRTTGHGIGYYRCQDWIEFVFGVDYLGREDIRILPVGGAILRPHDGLRLELVFPKPKIAARVDSSGNWLTLSGELGGGTWAVERMSGVDDLATYHDLRLSIGVEKIEESGDEAGGKSGFDVGFVFDRSLEYGSGVGDLDLPDTFMIRCWHVY